MPVLSPTHATSASAKTIDFEALKARQQATWSSGDFAVIGRTTQIVAELLAEAAGVEAGEQVLDVAAGSGNASLAAARRFARVTSTDYVPALLERGAQRARAEGLAIEFRTADAEALPFSDHSFDVALSTFGAMFAPRHDVAAGELLRVVRPGGRIGLANWTPEGFIGRLFDVIATRVPPPAGLKPPTLWGTETLVVELFGARAADIRCVRRQFNFRYASAEHWLQVFREYYGPTRRAFLALETDDQTRLAADITTLLQQFNTARTPSLVVPGEYLEVVIHIQ